LEEEGLIFSTDGEQNVKGLDGVYYEQKETGVLALFGPLGLIWESKPDGVTGSDSGCFFTKLNPDGNLLSRKCEGNKDLIWKSQYDSGKIGPVAGYTYSLVLDVKNNSLMVHQTNDSNGDVQVMWTAPTNDILSFKPPTTPSPVTTSLPTTFSPSVDPTASPSETLASLSPSYSPTHSPTEALSSTPTNVPTKVPTKVSEPSFSPSATPSYTPTTAPSLAPTKSISSSPTLPVQLQPRGPLEDSYLILEEEGLIFSTDGEQNVKGLDGVYYEQKETGVLALFGPLGLIWESKPDGVTGSDSGCFFTKLNPDGNLLSRKCEGNKDLIWKSQYDSGKIGPVAGYTYSLVLDVKNNSLMVHQTNDSNGDVQVMWTAPTNDILSFKPPTTPSPVTTSLPTTFSPSVDPTASPSETLASLSPSYSPTHSPTEALSSTPTNVPTKVPTKVSEPSFSPSATPSYTPTTAPPVTTHPRTTSIPSFTPTSEPSPAPVASTPHTLAPFITMPTPTEPLSCVSVEERMLDIMMDPLECNDEIDTQPCTLFTSEFPDVKNSDTIEIPCGVCVIMDHQETKLVLSGLDIRGKLVFPDGYKLTLTVNYIFVQGVLEMRSSKIVNGTPDVKFILTGTSDVEFVSAGTSDTCKTGCDVGKKPIVVSGGKLVIHGLEPTTPTWIPLHDVLYPNADTTDSLIVSDSILNKWGVGAEVVITSHTLNFDDSQVRTITKISSHEKGFVALTLNSNIKRPSTFVDNPYFAVEVALLSRNILFQGDNDDALFDRHGAHLMFFLTKNPQELQGVEFRNFGQQGTLARYPIHFHVCQNSCGSIVSKNLIRESNQRCVVIHGTHNVKVEENIAFDTAGHCFMTEDGNEVGNSFRRNLGAMTKRVIDLIPDNGSNGRETDNEPSTFWATSATNSWEGNVAAGSEGSGFWFELRLRVRGPSKSFAPSDLMPFRGKLISFRDNVAHSNRDHGIRTYPNGWVPDEQAIFFNSRSYRNYQAGVFIHNSRDMAVLGGVFADNRRSIDFDRAEKMELRNVDIIGYSDEYKKIVQTEQFKDTTGKRCPPHVKLVGIDMHTFTRKDHTAPWIDFGAQISNVSLSGFVDTGCENGKGAYALNFEEQVESKMFDYFVTLQNIQIENKANWIDFCSAEKEGVTDIFVIDSDSSLKPSSVSFEGTSSLISRTEEMSAFIDKSKCTDVDEHCYSYCPDTCLRRVTYLIDPADTENYKLRVCDKSDTTKCIEVSGNYYYEYKGGSLNTLKNTISLKSRYFAVSLPKREAYTAVFLDENNDPTWPSYVETKYQKIQCAEALIEDSIILEDTVKADECDNLIKNGDAEASSEKHMFWLHRSDGIQVKKGEGIEESNAFSDVTVTTSSQVTFVQYLDTRCLDLEVGNVYEVKAWAKLQDDDGSIKQCNRENENCPELRITTRFPSGDDIIQSSFMIGQAVRYFELLDGYFLLHGEVTITRDMASASAVQLNIKRNRRDSHMYIDNVSMERVEPKCDDELIQNGDFKTMDSRYWDRLDARSLDIVTPGVTGTDDYALKSSGGSAKQLVRLGCIQEGQRYLITSKFKLLTNDKCDPDASGSKKCPQILFRAKLNGSFSLFRAKAIGSPSDKDWNTIYGIFEADNRSENAEELRLQYENLNGDTDLIVDDVSVKKIPMDCTDLDQEIAKRAKQDGICK